MQEYKLGAFMLLQLRHQHQQSHIDSIHISTSFHLHTNDMLYSSILSLLLIFQMGPYVTASPQQESDANFLLELTATGVGAVAIVSLIIVIDRHRTKFALDSLEVYKVINTLSIDKQKLALNKLQDEIVRLQARSPESLTATQCDDLRKQLAEAQTTAAATQTKLKQAEVNLAQAETKIAVKYQKAVNRDVFRNRLTRPF